jgi:histone H3/H4
MQVITTNPVAAMRFGRQQADVDKPLTLEDIQKALEQKKTIKDTQDALKQAPVAVIVKEEKKEETVYKKARDLSHEEKIANERAKLRAFTPLYKDLGTPVDQYLVSPRWEAVKNAHYSGALGSGFGAMFGELISNYANWGANTLNFLHSTPVVGGFIPGNGHIPVVAGGHEAVLPLTLGIGALAGTGAAIGKHFSTRKENADYETLMRLHPEKASKWNLITDERLEKLRGSGGLDDGKTDANLERRVMGWFAPPSALPGELLKGQSKGWVFPWNMTSAVTAPLQSIPVLGGFFKPVQDAIVTAQNDGRDKVAANFNWGDIRQQVVDTPGQVYGLATQPVRSLSKGYVSIKNDLQDTREAKNALKTDALAVMERIKKASDKLKPHAQKKPVKPEDLSIMPRSELPDPWLSPLETTVEIDKQSGSRRFIAPTGQ